MPLMVLLGLGVRNGATPVDGWFQQGGGPPLGWLLLFTDAGTAKARSRGRSSDETDGVQR